MSPWLEFILFSILAATAVGVVVLRHLFAVVMLGGVFSLVTASLFVVLDYSKGTPVSLAQAKELAVPVIAYGAFVNEIVHFVIVGFAVFLLVAVLLMAGREGWRGMSLGTEGVTLPTGPVGRRLSGSHVRRDLSPGCDAGTASRGPSRSMSRVPAGSRADWRCR